MSRCSCKQKNGAELPTGNQTVQLQAPQGHVNITTTMIYAEVSEENTKNDHKKYIV